MTNCKRRQTNVELKTITILGRQIIPPTVIFKCKYDSTAWCNCYPCPEDSKGVHNESNISQNR